MDEKVIAHYWELINQYGFPMASLARYLNITMDQARKLNANMLNYDLSSKIEFLYYCGEDDKDLKTQAFLEVLVNFHQIKVETIAQMAHVDVAEVNKMLSYPFVDVDQDVKYRVATTVMALRFFLKENETFEEN